MKSALFEALAQRRVEHPGDNSANKDLPLPDGPAELSRWGSA